MSYGGGFGTTGGLLEGLLGRFRKGNGGHPPADPEAGPDAVAGARRMSQASGGRKRLTLTTTDANALIPQGDKLLMFRALTGIDTIPAVTAYAHSVRTGPNIGIYTRVIESERSAAKGYHFYSLMINLFLGTQIVVAAILTSLGAANGPHAAVTAFGAINTIIAGAMTYLKGSGLPNILRHHENEWRVVREYIEQREREFCLADCTLDVNEELLVVEEMYKNTKSDLESGSSQGVYKSGGNEPGRNPMVRPPTASQATRPVEKSEEAEKHVSSSAATTADKI